MGGAGNLVERETDSGCEKGIKRKEEGNVKGWGHVRGVK